MEQNFAFCKWVPYVVKTNSVFNKLKIYANTSFVFPLSKKSYDFSEALIVPPSKRQKTPNSAETRCFCAVSVTLCVEDAAPYSNEITIIHYKFGVVLTTLSTV